MPGVFTKRFVVEVRVIEVTHGDGCGSRTPHWPPMSGKKKSMTVARHISVDSEDKGATQNAQVEEMFTRSVDGFSPGILDHPKLYLQPEKSYRIVPKKDQERLLRFAREEPLPEHKARKP